MAVFPIQVCPSARCRTKHVAVTTLTVLFSPINQRVGHVLATCNSCGDPMIITVALKEPNYISMFTQDSHGNPFQKGGCEILGIVPDAVGSDVPEYLDPKVAAAFSDAEANVADRRPNSAAMSLRRALDIGLKVAEMKLTGSTTKDTLQKRIDALAKAGHLTASLKDWAHQVRLEGNEANHEVDEYTMDDAIALLTFTRYLFIYLFTLPEQVERAKAPPVT